MYCGAQSDLIARQPSSRLLRDHTMQQQCIAAERRNMSSGDCVGLRDESVEEAGLVIFSPDIPRVLCSMLS